MNEMNIPGVPERGKLCKTCAEACLKHWPSMTLGDVNAMLWEATAYPMGDCTHNVKMIDEMHETIGDDWKAAGAYADDQITKVHEAGKAEFWAMRNPRRVALTAQRLTNPLSEAELCELDNLEREAECSERRTAIGKAGLTA